MLNVPQQIKKWSETDNVELSKGPEVQWNVEKLDLCIDIEGSTVHFEPSKRRVDHEQVSKRR